MHLFAFCFIYFLKYGHFWIVCSQVLSVYFSCKVRAILKVSSVLFLCKTENAKVLSLIVFLFPVITSSFMIALFVLSELSPGLIFLSVKQGPNKLHSCETLLKSEQPFQNSKGAFSASEFCPC